MNAHSPSTNSYSRSGGENRSGIMLEPNTTADGNGTPLDQYDERMKSEYLRLQKRVNLRLQKRLNNIILHLMYPQTNIEHFPGELPQPYCHYPSLQTPAIQNVTKRASSSATTALFETIDSAHEKGAGNNLPHNSPLPAMLKSKASSACVPLAAMSSQPSHDCDINMPRAEKAEGNKNILLDKVFRLFSHSMRQKFPIKLYIMLESVQDDNVNANANPSIAWLPNGCGFCILDEDAFMEVVVPAFLKKSTNVRLFYEQLQSWGFKSAPNGKGARNWCNQFFLRHVPEELTKMERNKNTGGKKAIIAIRNQRTFS